MYVYIERGEGWGGNGKKPRETTTTTKSFLSLAVIL